MTDERCPGDIGLDDHRGSASDWLEHAECWGGEPPTRIGDLRAGPDRHSGASSRPDAARVALSFGTPPKPRAVSRPVRTSPGAWGMVPAPAPLDPPPGFECDGLKRQACQVVGVLVLGLGDDDLERAVHDVTARQRASMDFKPVFLTDCPDIGPILKHGYAVDYLPRESGPEPRAQARRRDRIERLRSKWGISGLIGRWPGEASFVDVTPDAALAAVNDIVPVAAGEPLRAFGAARTTGVRRMGPPAAAWAALDLGSRPTDGLRRPAGQGPLISYCIPVMNRGADLRATLGSNLRENRRFGGLVEFIVVFFDQDQATQDWARRRFGRHVESGRLRVLRSDALDVWHFGKAKNAFRPLVRGRIYSSLDADNFVSAAETQQLIDVHAVHGDDFVFHHFSGQWGDGSSGRVSLPAALFREVGYNEGLLPRQFDEVDLILSALKKAPSAALICHHVDRNLITMSDRTRQFVRHEGLRNPFVHAPPVSKRAPLNPKPSGYVGRDEVLRAMTEFNQALSFIGNTTLVETRDRYVELAHSARQRLVDLLPGDALMRMLFEPARDAHGTAPRVPRPGPRDLCLFACVKDDQRFLPRFLDHYRRRGVTRFFLIDDHSDPPLRGALDAPDVHVFVPKVGTFLTAKGLWLETLMKAHLAIGAWALTVDADEFVDLPEGCPDFPTLGRLGAAQGKGWVSGLLIDMLPATPAGLGELDRDPGSFEEALPHCCSMILDPSRDYLAHASVRWGFGDCAGLSWMVDARFHAFGTFDSLRKIPFLRYRPGLHINQGLHTLHYTDGTPPLGSNLWQGDLVLPIRHYKLSKLLSGAAREHLSLQVRTAERA
jgi:hypothetical protein